MSLCWRPAEPALGAAEAFRCACCDPAALGHFDAISRPCIFLSGDKDPFGTPELFAQNVRSIKGEVSMIWLNGHGHDPKKGLEILTKSLNEWIVSLR